MRLAILAVSAVLFAVLFGLFYIVMSNTYVTATYPSEVEMQARQDRCHVRYPYASDARLMDCIVNNEV